MVQKSFEKPTYRINVLVGLQVFTPKSKDLTHFKNSLPLTTYLVRVCKLIYGVDVILNAHY